MGIIAGGIGGDGPGFTMPKMPYETEWDRRHNVIHTANDTPAPDGN